MIEWQWARFEELSTDQLYALLALREAVFVVEQNCAYQDADGLDRDAWHLLAWEARQLVACLRLLKPGLRFAEPSIGRVLTHRTVRGGGLGKRLLERGLEHAAVEFPACAIRISAQAYLRRFYEGFGFRCVSAPYEEDGIAHIEMLREPI